MNFNSIKEYFYKAYSYCFLLMLLPLCLLGLIHFQLLFNQMKPIFVEPDEKYVLIVLTAFEITALTIVHLYGRVRLDKIAKEFSLGKKLDHYFILTLVRLSFGIVVCLVMIGGYLASQADAINVLFMLVFAWMCFQVPTSRKACQELKLKGDQREMVFHKKDKF